ncbi:MAG TPA: exonuclease domain-containing protein, partial [Candidatus Paceibacterota bacterium]|nr:exonuclease domain-containing protein [Candidatus Paceibacterota bacterium]
MRAFPRSFVIIDTETTGMRPPFSRVIDLGIIRVEDGTVTERFETLINPGVSIPSYIRRFTSITDEDLQDAPSFEEIALQVEALLKDAVFVAHNAPFDYAFIKSEFRRLDMEFNAETLCSVRLSRALFPKERSHSLESIINRYGIKTHARHRAMPDAQAVWDFFQLIDKTVDAKEIQRAVQAVRQGGDSPAPRVARDTFAELPDSAGVYFFYGPEQELLYVGKSKHIRTR